MKTISLKSLKDTEKLARQLAKKLHGGDVLALTGELGSGKTTFTQALGREFGVNEVKSPTFVMMHVHDAHLKQQKLTLCHIDAYRLHDASELETIGFFEYVGAPNVITVIEWADRIKKAIPKKSIWINFWYDAKKRTATLS